MVEFCGIIFTALFTSIINLGISCTEQSNISDNIINTVLTSMSND